MGKGRYILNLDKLSETAIASLHQAVKRNSNTADLHTVKDGIQKTFEADWVKYMEFEQNEAPQIDRLFSALAFYADENNYYHPNVHYTEAVKLDRGEKARQALSNNGHSVEKHSKDVVFPKLIVSSAKVLKKYCDDTGYLLSWIILDAIRQEREQSELGRCIGSEVCNLKSLLDHGWVANGTYERKLLVKEKCELVAQLLRKDIQSQLQLASLEQGSIKGKEEAKPQNLATA